jgi:hypothetical protein
MSLGSLQVKVSDGDEAEVADSCLRPRYTLWFYASSFKPWRWVCT